MKITYDPTVDALYIEFNPGPVVTQQINDDIALDFDADGHIAGIEILAVREHLSAESLFSIHFEQLMNGVLAEAV